jgi:hypothetical protein
VEANVLHAVRLDVFGGAGFVERVLVDCQAVATERRL